MTAVAKKVEEHFMDQPHGVTTGAPATALLEARNVSKRFVKRLDMAGRLAARMGANLREEVVHAVDGVSLAIPAGEVVGLVGESGCGKSTFGRVVAGIHPATEGQVFYRGQDVGSMNAAERAKATLAVQMIFQDPFASLNPRMRVSEIVGEAPLYHGLVDRAGYNDYVDDVLNRVGLDPTLKRRFPHQFSGGQRQRIGIARALAVKPEFLVCDEAIAALDVSIQAQVINLFMDLREQLDLTYLFISHDLSVVEHISDRVVIMYLGRVVESAPTEELFRKPNHPYAQALLAEVPRIDERHKTFVAIKGEIPSPLDPPKGCHFHPRCPHAFDRCKVERPVLREIAPGRHAACHLNDQPSV
ncbi:ABC transporter ATP-binding protein [Futiania mangrovi]